MKQNWKAVCKKLDEMCNNNKVLTIRLALCRYWIWILAMIGIDGICISLEI